MSAYGKTITHESVSFRKLGKNNMFGCFGNWFNTKDQEIGAYYIDGELHLERVADFLVDMKDNTCGYGCELPLLPEGETTFEVEVARFWDGDGGTDDVEILGNITLVRKDGIVTDIRLDMSVARRR